MRALSSLCFAVILASASTASAQVALVRVIEARGELNRARVRRPMARLRRQAAACAPAGRTERVVLYGTVQRGRVVSSGIYGPHDGTTDQEVARCVERLLHGLRFSKSRTYRSSPLILSVSIAPSRREARAALNAPGPTWLSRGR